MRRRGTVIIGGVNIAERFGLIMTNASEFNPPAPVTNFLEIPGMDGVLDLSEALTGDAVYSNREETFEFAVYDPANFEVTRTQLSNFLHGRAFDFQLSWEQEYVYHGRFSIDQYPWYAHHATITLKVTADPWKRADPVHLEVPAANGVEVHLPNRRRRVSPTITCISNTVIGYKTHSWALDPGEHYMNELVLDPGDNVIFIDSKPAAGPNTWNDVLSKFGQSVTWDRLRDMRWSEVAKYGVTIDDDPTSIVQIDYDTYDL